MSILSHASRPPSSNFNSEANFSINDYARTSSERLSFSGLVKHLWPSNECTILTLFPTRTNYVVITNLQR